MDGDFHIINLGTPPHEKGPFFTRLPFWGLVVVASAVLLFAVNVKRPWVGVFCCGLVFLSVVLKIRFRISRIAELLVPMAAAIIPTLLFHGLKALENLNFVAILSLLVNYLTILLFFMILITIYKVKRISEMQLLFISSLLIVIFASLYSPWRYTITNIVLFVIYSSSSILFFMDLTLLSHPLAVSGLRFSKIRAVPLLVGLPVVLLFCFAAGFMLKSYEFVAGRLLNMIRLPQTTSAFQSNSKLGTMENILQSDQAAMRIFSRGMSFRVRAVIYDRYENGEWKAEPAREKIPRLGSIPAEIAGKIQDADYPLFPLGSREILESNAGDDFSPSRYLIFLKNNHIVYYPDNAAFVSARLEYLERDPLGSVTGPAGKVDGYEMITCGANKNGLVLKKPGDMDLYVPEKILPDIKRIAETAVNGGKTPRERALEIERYLGRNHTYKAGITLTRPDMDPVQEFLVHKRSAHCEYFASSMVLMLRSLGVQARYVVGYVAHRYNPAGEYYLVKDRDAHAWVMAFLPGEGWVEFDPTPPSGRPQGGMGKAFRKWIDYIITKFQLLYYHLKTGGIRKFFLEALAWVQSMARTQGFIIMVVIILLTAAAFKWRKKIARLMAALRWKKKDGVSGMDDPMAGLMAGFDEKLKKLDIIRPRHLTLMEFARQLPERGLEPEAAENGLLFLREYNLARYSGKEMEEGDLAKLAEYLEKIGLKK